MVFAFLIVSASLQSDTLKYGWPNPPFDQSHYINATFAEYRNTLTSNHFHNAVDIGEPDGNPIYPTIDGVVHSVGPSSTQGSNAYVRVRTQVGSEWKHITYLHIEPNPALTPGMSVIAGQTILGTIIPGMGHVHLTEREMVSTESGTGVEMNNLRAGGGLSPFVDIWPPVIDKPGIRFRRSGTSTLLSPGALYGNVDIIVKVSEQNSPEPLGGTRTNNGAYAVGFRILTADTQVTVFEPPDAGLRYRFDRKPNDSYTGNVFDESQSDLSNHYFIITNGAGAADVNATRTVLPSSINVDVLPESAYLLHVYSFDTRNNWHHVYVPIAVTKKDLYPPAAPVLRSVLPAGDSIRVAWSASPDPDVAGYRLYYQYDGVWTMAANESVLTAGTFQYTFGLPPGLLMPSNDLPRFAFKVTAVDTVTPRNESAASDTYGGTPASLGVIHPADAALIVDGFDRWTGTGSWTLPTHAFAVSAMQAIRGPIAVGTAANEAVADGSVPLGGAHYVHWVLGDESTADRTFTSAEQASVRAYLEGGGSLFVSGSEVGWDLGRTHALTEPGDLAFYNNYLKSSLFFDGNGSMINASGVAGTPFQGFTWTFGQVFPEDYPDDIEPAGGSTVLLNYNVQRDASNFRKAGVGFVGTFGASSTAGRMVYVAFPLESMTSTLVRQTMVDKALLFMGITTGIGERGEGREGDIPVRTELRQNYPNPFNPTTEIRYQISEVSGQISEARQVRLTVHDLLGREVAVLVNEERSPGIHTVAWNAAGMASGQYFARLVVDGRVQVRSMVLLK